MWLIFTISVTKTIIWATRLFGAHGTALPGLIAEQLYPHILQRLTRGLPGGVVMVTGTNGKTTTAKVLRHTLEAQGKRVLANRSGSNFTRGIISSLVEHVDWRGRADYDMAVLEVDEAYTPRIAEEVKPKLIIVLNVMRDQLDRYGEIDKTARVIGKSLAYAEAVVLNADDPPVAALGNDVSDTTYFGTSVKLQKLLPSDEELHGNLKPKPAKKRIDVELTSFDTNNSFTTLELKAAGQRIEVKTQLEGVHNFVNIAAVTAAVWRLNGGLDQAALAAIAHVEPAFGRGERVTFNGTLMHVALVKNPAGFNQNLRSYLNDKVGLVLFIINDRYADGRDVSWLWDIDLEPLKKQPDVSVMTAGIRAPDMSLRLSYEDITLAGEATSIKQALKLAAGAVPADKEVLILPTYTAMLEARKELGKQAELEEIWQ